MKISLKRILRHELTERILSTSSAIQINILNYQSKGYEQREKCVHVSYLQKQLKIFQFKNQKNI